MYFRPLFSLFVSKTRAQLHAVQRNGRIVLSWLLALLMGGALLCSAPSAFAQEENSAGNSTEQHRVDANGYYVGGPVYVSDKNTVWTRSGPGEGYRVTGSRQIGERLTFRHYSDNGRYAQLADEDGKTFWMPLTAIQPAVCGEPLAEQLREQISKLQYRLENYDNELSANLKDVQSKLDIVTKENAELKEAMAQKVASRQDLEERYQDASSRLETKELDMQMRWWRQGALIALAGAIIGVILVFIPRPRRKQRRERY